MNTIFERYKQAVLSAAPFSDDLRISSSGKFATYYAPFDHINRSAKVVLVGITPGQFQAEVGLRKLRESLVAGRSDEESLRRAKEAASFSGAMRNSLVNLLDNVGLNRVLGLQGCATLFGETAGLVHYTSSLRYPVLLDGKNYGGTPGIMRTPYLLNMVETWLAEEAQQLSHAVWIPLGKEPTAALGHLVSRGHLDESRVLAGLPHPSPANAERVSYFLGKKPRERLSSKTNAALLEAARSGLVARVTALDSI